jgi:sugar (pentulose or hexulose) kinase
MTGTRDVVVGIDAGTTFVKAAIVRVDGIELSHGRSPTPWREVATGAEADPHAFVDAALDAVHEALEPLEEIAVRAVGVTSMAETGALLDGSGTPVAPAIAWHDLRGDEEAASLARELGSDRFTRHTGLRPNRVCSMSKYRWLRARYPHSGRGSRWLSVAEWIVRALGGEEVGELSLASRTGALDVVGRSWWAEALEWAGAPPGLMPVLVPAGTEAGTVGHGPEALRGATLTVAGHDHLCAAVGAGATHPGDVLDSCGTAEALVRAVEPPSDRAKLLRARDLGLSTGCHVLARRGALMGGFSSGGVMGRLLDRLGASSDDARARLDEASLAIPRPPGGSLPTSLGELSLAVGPLPDGVTPERLWRTVLEEVTDRAQEVLAGLEALQGPAARIVVTGGWARSRAFRVLKEAKFGPFDYPLVPEPGARGAALIAGCAAGVYDSVDAAPSPGDSTRC